MLFRRRKPAPGDRRTAAPPTPPPEPGAGRGGDLDLADHALDTVAALLRSYGRHAFEVEGVEPARVRELCERWAQHVLVAADEPGRTRTRVKDGEPQPPPPDRTRRNWAGVRHFFEEQRSREEEGATRSLGDFRQAVWAFIQSLSRAVQAEQDETGLLTGQLGRLRQAVERNAADQIKKEALATVGVVNRVLHERRRRQRAELGALGERIQAMRSELDEARERVARDDLTGLSSRGAFDEHLARVADLGVVFGQSGVLFMVDVDHFKWVNDTFGHPAGDAVLRAVAGAIRRCFLRREDFAARYGGEEFAILIPEEDPETVVRLGERVLDAMRDLDVEHEGEHIRVTVSVGAARLRPGESPERWLARADAALYEAKQTGRDRFVLADGEPTS